MASTNLSIASRYAMNIADDNPIAIYDVTPDPVAMQEPVLTGGGWYENQVWPNPPHPSVLDEVDRWVWFEIPSNHCTYNSSAYYLHSRYNGQGEWPVVSGLPMLYGGTNRARYMLLNRDVSGSEPPLPFLQLPSFGMGHDYEDRCRSLEFWMETDPYTHPVNMNLFDDQTAIYAPQMALGTHYTLVGTGFVLNPSHPLPNPDCQLISLNNTTITFIKDQPVIPAKRVYTFSITAKNFSADERADLTVSIKLTQNRIDSPDLVKTYTDIYQVYKTDGWTTYNFEFVANEAMTWPTVEVSLYADKSMYLTEMGLWAGQGGAWQPPGVDSGSDIEFFSTARPTEILSVGGPTGTAVTVLADDGYLYMRSFDQIDSYYVGEWGRQMYMVLVDEGAKYSLYMNAERILSVPKSTASTTGVIGEYTLFYISPLFKYIDIATIAVYPRQISTDLMRLHYIFGTGPKYSDTMKKMPYEKAYIADGSAVDFSGHCLFPQSHSFNRGVGFGVNSSGNTLTLPEYTLPPLINANYEDIVYELASAEEYSMLYFKLPENSYMSWSPKRDVDDTINYVFIDVASLLSNNVPGQNITKICRVESAVTPYVLDFYIEIDLATVGDFEDADFNRDFSTTEKRGSIYAVMYDGTTTTEVFRQQIIQSDFSLVFNIEALSNYEVYPIAMMFSDPEFNIVFDSGVELKSLSAVTREHMLVNDIFLEGETDLPAISIDGHYDDFGTDRRGLMQNATYMVYPNVNTVDGQDVIFLDIAAFGYWKVNIPLANLAASINGEYDLDFILYSDSERLPQIVSGLNTNRLTYSEIASYIMARSQGWPTYNQYAAAQTLFTGTPYAEVGLEVQNVVPTLGRFANPPVQTFVTLDSQSRFPFKEYASLSTVKATTSMFIDFENSSASILDSKWEIFNNFAIRVPKQVRLQRYELAYAVHMRSASLTLQRPIVRRADFFGVSSGTGIANNVKTGNGGRIFVGNSTSYNTGITYSARIPTETFPSLYMPKSFGFYPHSGSTTEAGTMVYRLSDDSPIKTITFYMLWRSETFPNDPAVYPDYVDRFASIAYTNTSDLAVTNTIQVRSGTGAIKINANVEATTAGPTIYVDGVEDGLMWVNKWHLVQIDVPDIKENLTFAHFNSNAVVNFVTSSVNPLDPAQVYATRTGTPHLQMIESQVPVLSTAKGYLLNRTFDYASNPPTYTFQL